MKRSLAIAATCLLPVAAAQATVPEPAPWAPRAAAYRLTLFMGNLDPVPWEKLGASWEYPVAGASVPASALSRVTGEEARALRTALEARDRQALFEAATEAVAGGILRHLAVAGESPGEPEAAVEVARAGSLYRALSDGIEAGDPDGAHALGLDCPDPRSGRPVGCPDQPGSGRRTPMLGSSLRRKTRTARPSINSRRRSTRTTT